MPGYKIYGTPYQPEFCDWAFNLDRGEPCLSRWRMIPSDADIVVRGGLPALVIGIMLPSAVRL